MATLFCSIFYEKKERLEQYKPRAGLMGLLQTMYYDFDSQL